MTKLSLRTATGPLMTPKAFDVAAFIGRFQILHEGHLAVIREGLKQANHLVVLIGSATSPRCHRNPFTYDERVAMLMESIPAEDRDRVITMPLEDAAYNDAQWVLNVQKQVAEAVRQLEADGALTGRPKPSIALIGHSKDASSYYLKLFPQWDSINVPNYRELSSTGMREAYFSSITDLWLKDCDGHKDGDLPQDHLVPTPVKEFLTAFSKTSAFKDIKSEYEFVSKYKAQWAAAPYPVIFVTTDACVVQSGHVLLVRRKGRPGRGLFALPGGFLNYNETVEEGMLRELREETKIAVPTPVLKGSIVAQRVFDDPNRSSRGRTITHAFLIHLRPDTELAEIKRKKGAKPALPEVIGSDDAEKAVWVPLSEIKREMMFEDHCDMIIALTSLI